MTRNCLAIVAALLATLFAYGCWSSARSGLFNNVVDERVSLREHDRAWAARMPTVVTTRRLLRLVQGYGGACAASTLAMGSGDRPAGGLLCQVDRPGRLAAMMPSEISWSILFRRVPGGWRLAGRVRHEIAM